MQNNTQHTQTGNTLAIIGAGPNCTYAVERLAANFRYYRKQIQQQKIYIFDKSGLFGAGEVHSPYQPDSSFLNRISGQVCFAADESNTDAGPLLDKALRPTLHEWCQEKYRHTGDEKYNISAKDWPKRNQHGEALVEAFNQYVDILSAIEGVEVFLIQEEVIDIKQQQERFLLSTLQGRRINCDDVLLVTGHSWAAAERDAKQCPIARFADQHPRLKYINAPYPLEQQLIDIDEQQTVAVAGLGLTAMDVFLFLTEARGGRFIQSTGGELIYIPSGKEPKKIIGYSRSGLFTFARPDNQKEDDIANLEHKGKFLTKKTIDSLRKHRVASGTTKLCFESAIWPLVHLEQNYIYYKTLFGELFGQYLVKQINPAFNLFLSTEDSDLEGQTAIQLFDNVINRSVLGTMDCLRRLFSATYEDQAQIPQTVIRNAALGFLEFLSGVNFELDLKQVSLTSDVFAKVVGQIRSPWGHASDPKAHIYNWKRFENPLKGKVEGEEYTAALIEFMEYDNQQAYQNNLRNPFKATCDGVWRDLRQVLAYAIDSGGLTPQSHQQFLRKYLRLHNRLANGACVEVMEKMLALIKAGMLDISLGPSPELMLDKAAEQFVLNSNRGKVVLTADVFITAKVHDFNPQTDRNPLYRNLLEAGIIREWRNHAEDASYFAPGGPELDKHFNTIGEDNQVNHKVTILGPPTEGKYFFQIGAARPMQNHHVLNDVIQWANRYMNTVLETHNAGPRKKTG